jgi:transglutaminase-like putative cysteine protease
VSIHAALTHTTHYKYDRLVTLSPQLVRLRPAPHCRTPIVSYTMQVEPDEHFVHWQQDPQSNYLARLTFPQQVREMRITVNVVAELSVYNPFDFFVDESAEYFPFTYTDWQARELRPFLECEAVTPLFGTYLAAVPRDRKRTVDFLVELNRLLCDHIRYVIRLDPGVQATEETLERRSGSCRDSTWLLVQLLRHLGIAARFVSGYLIQLVPDVRSLDGPSGPAQDFTDLHAWCEAYVPGAGWVGLDPTSGLLAGEGHIPLSCTPDPASAAPVTGAVDDCEVKFHHHMQVQRIYESPRVTKPYSDAQWNAITIMGHRVDEELRRLDVRLTMGGEPTFVGIDDRDADEWNTSAVGPTKRLRAADLLWRLRRHYAPAGVVHFGQGKWYPGEQLPRWALGCYWRKDGEPAWRDVSLFANEAVNYGFTAADAERFLRTLAATLAVPDTHVTPGYEDTFYYLWRERQLPVNVDPFDARLDDELERERLRRIFSAGLSAIVGHALPLARGSNGTWRTGPWHLRGERMYLLPGDSAMGYRLPLDSLPWVSKLDYPYLREHDPFEQRPPLPRFGPEVVGPGFSRAVEQSPVGRALCDLRQGSGQARPSEPEAAASPGGPDTGRPAEGPRPTDVVRSALCAEVRNGVLYVFVPPGRTRPITWSSRRRSKRPRRNSGCPCSSKVIRRRTTRAWSSFRLRRTRV